MIGSRIAIPSFPPLMGDYRPEPAQYHISGVIPTAPQSVPAVSAQHVVVERYVRVVSSTFSESIYGFVTCAERGINTSNE